MKKRILIAAAAALLALPALAVFKEENLTRTLSVLLTELREDYAGITRINNNSQRRVEAQHQQLVTGLQPEHVPGLLGDHDLPLVANVHHAENMLPVRHSAHLIKKVRKV